MTLEVSWTPGNRYYLCPKLEQRRNTALSMDGESALFTPRSQHTASLIATHDIPPSSVTEGSLVARAFGLVPEEPGWQFPLSFSSFPPALKRIPEEVANDYWPSQICRLLKMLTYHLFLSIRLIEPVCSCLGVFTPTNRIFLG